MDKMILNDGNQIPVVGFGVFMIPNNGPTYDALYQALKAGYRHIDTAAAYFNEEDVGRAVKDSGIPREDIFITSKLWLQDYGYEQAKIGIARSLRKLDLGYIDLYLIHQPYGDVTGAWKAMEEAKEAGQIKSIGDSNMTPKIWNQYVPQFKTKPAVNKENFVKFQIKMMLNQNVIIHWDMVILIYQDIHQSLHQHKNITRMQDRFYYVLKHRMGLLFYLSLPIPKEFKVIYKFLIFN